MKPSGVTPKRVDHPHVVEGDQPVVPTSAVSSTLGHDRPGELLKLHHHSASAGTSAGKMSRHALQLVVDVGRRSPTRVNASSMARTS
jgi:hypothetical protein